MNTKFEQAKLKEGFGFVIGVDEAGRGSLAGPVVAAAVAWDLRFNLPAGKAGIEDLRLKSIKDSKLLTSAKREELAPIIKQNFLWAIGQATEKEIDKLNIHHAALLAMQRAIKKLIFAVIPSESDEPRNPLNIKLSKDKGSLHSPSVALGLGRDDKNSILVAVDGRFIIPDLDVSQEAIVGGDNKIFCIAAASIIAKVHRDALMKRMHKRYPKYNFAKHKGYGTLHHRRMLKQYGPCPIHRESFALIKK